MVNKLSTLILCCRACAVAPDHLDCSLHLLQVVGVWQNDPNCVQCWTERRNYSSCLCFHSYRQGLCLLSGCTARLRTAHCPPIPQALPCRALLQPICPELVSLPDALSSQDRTLHLSLLNLMNLLSTPFPALADPSELQAYCSPKFSIWKLDNRAFSLFFHVTGRSVKRTGPRI